MKREGNSRILEKINKYRWLVLICMFSGGVAVGNWINTSDVMMHIGNTSNIGLKNVALVEVVVYSCVVLFMFIGYKLQVLLEKRNVA